MEKNCTLSNIRARYYDSSIGRWTSEDPLGFDAGDSNLFRYVQNMHTVAIDPSGFDFIWQFDAKVGDPKRVLNGGKVYIATNATGVYRGVGKNKGNNGAFANGMYFKYEGPNAKNVRWIQFLFVEIHEVTEAVDPITKKPIGTPRLIDRPDLVLNGIGDENFRSSTFKKRIYTIDTINQNDPYYQNPNNQGLVTKKSSILFDEPIGVRDNAESRHNLWNSYKSNYLGTVVTGHFYSYAVDTDTCRVLAEVNWKAYSGFLNKRGKELVDTRTTKWDGKLQYTDPHFASPTYYPQEFNELIARRFPRFQKRFK